MRLQRMSRLNSASLRVLGVALLALIVAGSALALPRPTIYGTLSATSTDGRVIFWDKIAVPYEIERITVNVTAPCGDFSEAFSPGETPFFDLAKLEGELDGTYSYDLVITPAIDRGVQEQLNAVRGTSKEQSTLQALWDAGLLPKGPFRQSGFFEVERGAIVPLDTQEEGAKSLSGEPGLESQRAGVDTAAGAVQNISAAQSIIDSLCVGFDCPLNPTFDDTTILMMENNTRIKFDDTSTAASFPRNDWEIEANSRTNGGGSYLAFNDCGQSSQGGCADDPVFLVEAGARRNALYVESSGEVGIGTANPVLELHAVSGDSPGLRLEQDTSSGFAAQTWDIVGNETSFFIRDATNGSTLPFRIRPGASSNALVIDSDDDVGIGVLSPAGRLHVENTAADDEDDFIVTSDGQLTIGSTNAGGLPTLMKLTNPNAGIGGGDVRFVLENAAGSQWSFTNDNIGTGELEINYIPNAGTEVVIDGNGDVTATSFNPTSSRTLKNNFESIQPKEILAKLAELPITTWSFIWEDGTRHLGPMAEEFKAAFGLGDSEKKINLTDAAGVAFAAIQGLQLEIEEKDQVIADLLVRLERLEQRMEDR